MCKTNRPPHTTVRAPGEFEASLMMEHVLEHVAAHLGLDPALVKERNFMGSPAGECLAPQRG